MRILQYVISLLFLLTISLSSSAENITVEFTATVSYIDDYGNALGNSIKQGDQITGTYTLDSNMIDYDPNPDYANYNSQPPLAPDLGFNLNLPNLTYVPTNDSTDLNVYIYNGPSFEHYTVISCCSAGSLSNGAKVEHIFLDMVDDMGTTLNAADLSIDVSTLNAMPNKVLFIDGRGGSGTPFHIEASVSMLAIPGAICTAPEPTPTNTLDFTATVNHIDSPNSTLAVNVGDKISGRYTLNPATPDSDPSPEYAYYDHPQGDAGANIKLTMAGSSMVGDQQLQDFNVFVANSSPATGSDHFSVAVWNVSMLMPGGGQIQDIAIDFFDPDGVMLNTTSMIDSNPTSIIGWMYRDVHIHGVHPDGTLFNIYATIDSINTTPDPVLPASPLTISPASGVFIPQQHFHTAIILDPGLPPIVNHNVLLIKNGFTETVPSCVIGPVTPDNRQTLLCSSPVYQLDIGQNVMSVEVELANGVKLNNQATWELLPQ